MKKSSGFTLVEILIAVTILSFIAVFLAQSISTGMRDRKKIQNQIDKTSSVRDSLSIISRDIQMAFNYRDINIELYNEAQKERIAAKNKKSTSKKDSDKDKEKNPDDPTSESTTDTSQKTQETFKPKEQKILTHFMGSKDALHFTSVSNIRIQKNQKSSDQAEVGYFLETCKSRLSKGKESKCLWRRVSPVIDDKVDEGGQKMVLLENVTQFNLRYLSPARSDEPEWLDEWFSGEGADDTTRGKFPPAVEITLEVKDQTKKKSKPFAMTRVTQIRFPNNEDLAERKEEEAKTEDTSTDANSGGGQ